MKWGIRKSKPQSSSRKSGVSDAQRKEQRKQNIKKAAKIGAAVAITAAAAYGGYKLHQVRQSNKAAVGKFIYENGYMPKRKITGRSMYVKGIDAKTRVPVREYRTRQDVLTKSILGPELRSINTRSEYSVARSTKAKNLSKYVSNSYVGKGRIKNKIGMDKDERQYYADYYNKYIKGRLE